MGINGEPMIKPLVTFVQGVHEAVVTSYERINLFQTVFAHTANATQYAGQAGLRWMSKTCNSSKEASLVVAPDVAAKRKRPI